MVNKIKKNRIYIYLKLKYKILILVLVYTSNLLLTFVI